ncbi:MAG: hypothetical protein J5I93_07450 [Pirellulaceae bacterium]|nr:hypothetical protein [Pirellulaceae bacterium]
MLDRLRSVKPLSDRRLVRAWAGLVLWVAAAAGAVIGWRSGAHRIDASRLSRDLLYYAAGQRQVIPWQSEVELPVAVGDPVFLVLGPDAVRQIGEVSASRPAPSSRATGAAARTPSGQIVFYASAPALPAGARLAYHETPSDMRWVLETMLPPEKRQLIGQELQAALEQHQAEILQALRPVVEATLRDALPVVEQELAAALERHQAELEQLGSKYHREIVQRELLPLVKQEIWPIVVRHAEPTATEVGREIWQQASLWRFGWRYAYDISPLPEQRLTEREWQRFVREDATPILNSHIDDFVRVQQRILTELAENPRVQATLRASLARVLEDPELQQIVGRIMREVLVDNPRLAEVIRRRWQSEEAQQAVRLAASRVEPTVVRIGQLLLGTPEQGITPEFAQVLRNRILAKDRRWLVLELPDSEPVAAAAGGSTPLVVYRGSAPALNPFTHEPADRSWAERTALPGSGP